MKNGKCVTKGSDTIKNLIKLYEIFQESRGFCHERFKHLFLVTNLQAVCVYTTDGYEWIVWVTLNNKSKI